MMRKSLGGTKANMVLWQRNHTKWQAVLPFSFPVLIGKMLWQTQRVPTFGCIALSKKHLLAMLHWFDKAQHLYIFLYDV
jgi:hypothetical protein